ncbi:hypothetical protein AVEN_244959-1 [Araneus ventricosus]|uniref:Uncharacterized protein n=1 Tax=Araneus ventricosus TaxID=182803 RepID=A0A4Y2RVW0_ARAVE|nr:hypothetical protein AVEN_244959-1 [Araneus ventricosus]
MVSVSASEPGGREFYSGLCSYSVFAIICNEFARQACGKLAASSFHGDFEAFVNLLQACTLVMATEPDDELDRRQLRVQHERGVGQQHADLPERHLPLDGGGLPAPQPREGAPHQLPARQLPRHAEPGEDVPAGRPPHPPESRPALPGGGLPPVAQRDGGARPQAAPGLDGRGRLPEGQEVGRRHAAVVGPHSSGVHPSSHYRRVCLNRNRPLETIHNIIAVRRSLTLRHFWRGYVPKAIQTRRDVIDFTHASSLEWLAHKGWGTSEGFLRIRRVRDVIAVFERGSEFPLSLKERLGSFVFAFLSL